MTASNRTPPRRALVISDSDIRRDPRVMNHLRWLRSEQWSVDTLGLGERPKVIDGIHFVLGRRPFVTRLFSYLFLSPRQRFRLGSESLIPPALKSPFPGYDLVLVNETELLPWVVACAAELGYGPESPAHVHLDLHEFSLSESSSWVYSVLFARYRRWLAGFVSSPVFASRSAVSPGIAELYARHMGIPLPFTVMSCPPRVNQKPREVDEKAIDLIHHGKADSGRSLDVLVRALARLPERFRLTLQLVGSPRTIQSLQKLVTRLGVSQRVTFREPVPMPKVATSINDCDLELIFFPPRTENLRMALPNKFFEAIQGRLGLVIGPSPSMVEVANRFGVAAVCEGWTTEDLVETLTALTTDDIRALKAASDRAADDLNSVEEGNRFIASLDAAMKNPR